MLRPDISDAFAIIWPKKMEKRSLEENQFLLEEYKSKWDYIKHFEQEDFKFLQWYFTVAAASLGFLYKDGSDIFKLSNKPGAVPLLGFLVIYSFFANMYLFFRKQNYKRYNDRILAIEIERAGFRPDFPRQPLISIFRLRYSFVTLLGVGCSYLLALAELGDFYVSTWYAVGYGGIATLVTFLFAHSIRAHAEAARPKRKTR